MLRRIGIGVVISAGVVLAVALDWSAGAKPAQAFQACLNAFIARYPASTSPPPSSNSPLTSPCQLCHVSSGGGSSWNAYGSSLQQLGTALCSAPPFATVENLDADGLGGSNLAEINAGTQPGWCDPSKPGCNNQMWDRNGIALGTATPPGGVLLDPAPDTQAPTVPGNLTASATSASQINLAWSASTDNVGVTRYQVDRCQGAGCTTFAQVATPTGTSFSDTGLVASTGYSYRVRAIDAANNASANSSIVSATTQAAADTTPPSAPRGLSATAVSSAQINLAWTAATDNVGVTGYRVERCAGAGCTAFAQVATPSGASFNDTGLAAGTSYGYQVRAADAAGNLSAYSGVASATTASAPSGLVAGYAFSEASGTTTADASGNNNTGTLNGVTRTPAGKFGSALVFDGSDASFVDLGNSATLQLTGSMTISAWINSAAFPGDDAAIVSKRDSALRGYQLDTTVDGGPRTIAFKLTNATSGASMRRLGATVLQLNQWYHVAGVYDAAAQTINVYLNGVLDNVSPRRPTAAEYH